MSSSSSSSSSSSRLSLSPAIEAEVQARVAAEVQVRMSAMEPEIQLRVNRATAAAISQIMAGLYTGSVFNAPTLPTLAVAVEPPAAPSAVRRAASPARHTVVVTKRGGSPVRGGGRRRSPSPAARRRRSPSPVRRPRSPRRAPLKEKTESRAAIDNYCVEFASTGTCSGCDKSHLWDVTTQRTTHGAAIRDPYFLDQVRPSLPSPPTPQHTTGCLITDCVVWCSDMADGQVGGAPGTRDSHAQWSDVCAQKICRLLIKPRLSPILHVIHK